MSRLDRFILRLEAQRLLLNSACAEITAQHRPADGVIVELGLGNGRTYHHLREHLPEFRIVVFEREPTAHPSSTPAAGNLIVGEIEHAVPVFCGRERHRAVLVHADLGNGMEDYDRDIRRWLPGAVLALSHRDALVLTSTRIEHPDLTAEPVEGLAYEYYRYRVTAGER